MAFENELKEVRERKHQVLAMGGADKVKLQHGKGRLTARERIAALLDEKTFMEIGMLNRSDVPGMEARTPADGKIAVYGKINGRTVAIVANDFTTLASSSSRVAAKKEAELILLASLRGIPLIYLGDSGGARMPDIMGSKGLASFGGEGFDTFLRRMSRIRTAPMITAILGECFEMPTWMAALSDLVVQVKGTAMAVSGPKVLELAINEKVTSEELGGWKIQSEVSGIVDRVVDSELQCFKVISDFLSLLPSHHNELPPQRPSVDPRCGDQILSFLPNKRNAVYDMNRIVEALVDEGSIFSVKANFGKPVITCLARIGGTVVGLLRISRCLVVALWMQTALIRLSAFFAYATPSTCLWFSSTIHRVSRGQGSRTQAR